MFNKFNTYTFESTLSNHDKVSRFLLRLFYFCCIFQGILVKVKEDEIVIIPFTKNGKNILKDVARKKFREQI